MVDELSAVEAIKKKQKTYRQLFKVSFIVAIVFSSILFVVFPKLLPPILMQLIMLLSMGSVFGLFFLDRISYLLNKKFFKQDIVHKYIFQHLKPDDVHKDSDLVVDMINQRRKNSKEMRSV